jgi:hypothetical protein
MTGEEALSSLKREISLNRYEVDAGAVADAILSKLRLLRSGQAALASSAADRNPRSAALPPRDH